MKNNILVFIFIILGFSACDNSIDINAPWRETPVVFAIIDLGQDSQIIRIQKTFQNDENTSNSDVSAIADSLYLKNISVRITSNNNPNAYKDFIRLAPRKEAGFFSNKDSSYWGAFMPNWFAGGVSYQFKIHSNETGKDYIGNTKMVGKATIQYLATIDLINHDIQTFLYKIDDLGLDHAALMDLIVRVNYNEVNLANTADTTVKYVDYYAKKLVSTSTFNQPRYSQSINKKEFAAGIKQELTPNANVKRTFKSLEFVVIGYNSDYKDMLLINAPSGSIIPKFGEYTNISNSIGIFASRTTTKGTQNLNALSIDYLNNSILNP